MFVAIIHRTLTWTTGSLSCAQMLMHAIVRRGVRTPKESLHWKLILGRKSFAAPGNRTCVSGVTVRCSNHASYIPSPATSHPTSLSTGNMWTRTSFVISPLAGAAVILIILQLSCVICVFPCYQPLALLFPKGGCRICNMRNNVLHTVHPKVRQASRSVLNVDSEELKHSPPPCHIQGLNPRKLFSLDHQRSALNHWAMAAVLLGSSRF